MSGLNKLTARIAFGDDPYTVSNTWHTLTGVRRIVCSSSNRTRMSDSFVAGYAAITVDMNDREYDPAYSSSTHAGDFVWGTPVEVYDDSTRYLFRGFATRFTPDVSTHDATMTIECTDALGLFSYWELAEAAAVGAGESVEARVGRILDSLNWPSADRSIDGDTTPLAATTYGVSGLTELVNTARSAGGMVYYCAHDGLIHYEGRHGVQIRSRMASSQATFGTGGYNILDGSLVTPGVGDGYRNVVRVTDANGTVQTAGSVTSVQTERSIERTSLALTPPNLAQYWLDLYDTETAAPGVWTTIAAIGGNNIDQAAAAVRLRDRVTVAYDPPGTGTESIEVIVNGITHVATTSDWSITFDAQPADDYDNLSGAGSWMIVGDATLGRVGTGRVGY